MLNYSAISLDALVGPLSRNKVVLLLEINDRSCCDDMDVSFKLARDLGFAPVLLDDFSSTGLVVAEGRNCEECSSLGMSAIDYLRQTRFKHLIKGSLFIDGQLIECSGDGVPSTLDLLKEIMG